MAKGDLDIVAGARSEGPCWIVAIVQTGRCFNNPDVAQAMRRVLPGEPGDVLRPYLPTETKLARHLDKQSLRGLRSKRASAAANE